MSKCFESCVISLAVTGNWGVVTKLCPNCTALVDAADSRLVLNPEPNIVHTSKAQEPIMRDNKPRCVNTVTKFTGVTN